MAVVRYSEKYGRPRFEIYEDEEDGLLIRATRGHSLKHVDVPRQNEGHVLGADASEDSYDLS